MITNKMVEHIQVALNGLTKGKNANFGKNEPAGETAPESGILIVLTDKENIETFDSNKILASSTVLGKDDVNIFTVEGKTINVISIPYSETISVDTGTAKGFAIVQVTSGNLFKKSIVGSGTDVKPYDKYVINPSSLSDCFILFSGSLNGQQTIENDNSFSLSNIKITFN